MRDSNGVGDGAADSRVGEDSGGEASGVGGAAGGDESGGDRYDADGDGIDLPNPLWNMR